jgi:hypothetical protein
MPAAELGNRLLAFSHYRGEHMSKDSSTANILCSVIAVVITGAVLTAASNADAANFRTY